MIEIKYKLHDGHTFVVRSDNDVDIASAISNATTKGMAMSMNGMLFTRDAIESEPLLDQIPTVNIPIQP